MHAVFSHYPAVQSYFSPMTMNCKNASVKGQGQAAYVLVFKVTICHPFLLLGDCMYTEQRPDLGTELFAMSEGEG